MSELLHVAERVKEGARRLNWIVQLAETLERIGSLEQAEAEAQRKLIGTRAELQLLQKNFADAEEKAHLDTVAAQKRLAAAAGEADAVIREANAAAARELEQAKADAKDIEDQARAKADRIRLEAEKVKAMAEDGRKSAQSALESASKVLSARRDELADLDARLEKARAEARKIMGGA